MNRIPFPALSNPHCGMTKSKKVGFTGEALRFDILKQLRNSCHGDAGILLSSHPCGAVRLAFPGRAVSPAILSPKITISEREQYSNPNHPHHHPHPWQICHVADMACLWGSVGITSSAVSSSCQWRTPGDQTLIACIAVWGLLRLSR